MSSSDVITAHLPLARQIALSTYRKSSRCVISLEDMTQDAALGIVEAARTYQPERGIPFLQYAKHRARGSMQDGLRRLDEAKRGHRRELRAAGTVLHVVSDVSEAIPDKGKLPDQLAIERQSAAHLRAAVDSLPERWRQAVKLYYHDDMTLREIGKVLGVGGCRVSQILDAARRELRVRLGKYERKRTGYARL